MENNKMTLAVAKAAVAIYLITLTSALTADAHGDPIRQEALEATNKVREMEGQNLPTVCWNQTLEVYAKDYAKKRKCDCKCEHSNVENPTLCYGENLAVCTDDMNVSAAIDMWSAEKPDYCYETSTCAAGKMCGHYTQLIWKETTQIGCAKERCDNGGTFIICNYWPAGNILGQKPYYTDAPAAAADSPAATGR